MNQAEDYKIACEIRQYIAAVTETADKNGEMLSWMKWANGKADWFDPTLDYEDDYLGKRQHSKEKEDKDRDLETRGNYYRGFHF